MPSKFFNKKDLIDIVYADPNDRLEYITSDKDYRDVVHAVFRDKSTGLCYAVKYYKFKLNEDGDDVPFTDREDLIECDEVEIFQTLVWDFRYKND